MTKYIQPVTWYIHKGGAICIYLVVSHFWNALREVGGIIVLLVGAICKFDLTATWLLVNTPSDR